MNYDRTLIVVSLAICVVMLVAVVLGLVAVVLGNSSDIESEKIRAGLQQCLEKDELSNPVILWKKECKQ